jgi:hypothetical protein
LDKVKEIVKTAFSSLPIDQDEESSKLLVPKELENNRNGQSGDTNMEHCDQLDRLMCEVVDNL